MVTLTYANEWLFEKRQVTAFLKHCREYLKARGHGFRYVWVMELTKAGVPHYHVVIWLPRGITLPKPDKRGWWPWGHTRIEWARKPVGYLIKYASKAEADAKFPKGARLHGRGGLSLSGRLRVSWRRLPEYIRDVWGTDHKPTRAEGGGWISRLTGEFIASPWRLVGRCDAWTWLEFERVEGAT
jgi:hypothetical protein